MTYRLVLILLGVCLWTACTDRLEQGQKAGTETDGLVLSLSVDSHAAVGRPNDASLNEALVQRVDVFFVEKVGRKIVYKHAESGSEGKFTLSASGWQGEFPASEYEVYVLANMHSFDNPATPSMQETDLDWVKTEAQLLALTDTDVAVAKTEGEKSVDEGTSYTGKTFLMDGKTTWNADADRQSGKALIAVELTHAAAKISVYVTYTDGFLKPGGGSPDRHVKEVQKKLVRYVHRAKAVADGGEVVLPELQGEADRRGFAYADRTSKNTEGTARKDTLYAYTYPNDWSSDIEERETYLLLNVPYISGDGSADMHNNYYKIPVRVSGSSDQLRLERNMEYRVEVTIDREGNPEIVDPVDLKATFSVHPWKVETVEVTDETPHYLVLSEDTVRMHNIADTKIGFSSSSPIRAITVDKAYFIDKNGEEDYTEEGTIDIKTWIDVTDASGGALTGKIKINSPVPENVTLRYIDVTVTNTDGISKPLHIIQYPPEYIMGVPGTYSTRDDFTNNTFYNYLNKIEMPNVTDFVVGKQYGTSYYLKFESKGYNRSLGKIRLLEAKQNLTTGNYYLAAEKEDANYANFNNNRMYVVQVTSVNTGHILGRPEKEKLEETDSDEDKVAVSSAENNNLVSPMFMIASHLGTTYVGGNYLWTIGQEHCQKYVEVIDYGNGVYRELKDWRLPSYAELAIIQEKQSKATEVMESIVRDASDASYWTLELNKAYPDTRTNRYVRCIRDVTPEDLEEFRRNGIR